MAMRKVYSEIKGMKLKEVPGYFKPMLSMGYLKKSVQRGLDNYHAKYIETDSIEPLYHVCFGGMIFSYLVALPNERRHLEHKKHAEQHALKMVWIVVVPFSVLSGNNSICLMLFGCNL
ncbi:ATP synthase subunit f, mitochondrial [Gossypium australe]|uniref:ATP synthase subunit f, mitochondrial n=1 Tax=Gossypium australe TaxID=47621 RepID=A0A5B6WY16_9ROSI|nr:ATP synthase subunit f, mitochondrial [Gossypium australe]